MLPKKNKYCCRFTRKDNKAVQHKYANFESTPVRYNHNHHLVRCPSILPSLCPTIN